MCLLNLCEVCGIQFLWDWRGGSPMGRRGGKASPRVGLLEVAENPPEDDDDGGDDGDDGGVEARVEAWEVAAPIAVGQE